MSCYKQGFQYWQLKFIIWISEDGKYHGLISGCAIQIVQSVTSKSGTCCCSMVGSICTVFEGIGWFIRISSLWVVRTMKQTSHLHENLLIGELFWINYSVFEMRGGNSTSDLRMTRNVIELKQRLTALLIRSSRYMKVLPIHGNLRYTGHFFGSNSG